MRARSLEPAPLIVVLGEVALREITVSPLFVRLGHRLSVAEDERELAARLSAEPAALVVVDASELADGPAIMGAVRACCPAAEVVAVHPVGDVAGMWRSFRAGAVPWTRDGDRQLPVWAATAAPGGTIAREALHHELHGRHAAACRTLVTLRDPQLVAEAVEVLVDLGAASLERLRRRSRYPVRVELLVEHLPEHAGPLDGDDFSSWWSMVQAAAFRASGLSLPMRELELAAPPSGVLAGAFHATSTILRFTARRQWRRPAELLAEVATAEAR